MSTKRSCLIDALYTSHATHNEVLTAAGFYSARAVPSLIFCTRSGFVTNALPCDMLAVNLKTQFTSYKSNEHISTFVLCIDGIGSRLWTEAASEDYWSVIAPLLDERLE